ncbi:MAG: hypothetical protein ABL877_09930 [Thiobacillus sp.]
MDKSDMDDRKSFLIFEAVLLIGPVALLLAWAIPMMFFALLFRFTSAENSHYASILDGLVGYAGVIGGVIALAVLVGLVRKTIREELFSFNVWFWLGLGVGSYAAHYLYRITNAVTTALVVAPLFILVIHFMVIQRKLKIRSE